MKFDFYRITDENIRYGEKECITTAEVLHTPYVDKKISVSKKIVFLMKDFYYFGEPILLLTSFSSEVCIADFPSKELVSLFEQTPQNRSFVFGGYEFRICSESEQREALLPRYGFRKSLRAFCYHF